jgi:hypothetical protein
LISAIVGPAWGALVEGSPAEPSPEGRAITVLSILLGVVVYLLVLGRAILSLLAWCAYSAYDYRGPGPAFRARISDTSLLSESASSDI